MPNYKQMYTKLFNQISAANELLEQAQLDSENQYVESEKSPSLQLADSTACGKKREDDT